MQVILKFEYLRNIGFAFVFRNERKQFMESPDAAERRRDGPLAPFLLEFLEAFRDGQFIPFVLNVQQPAAGRAGRDTGAPTLGAVFH